MKALFKKYKTVIRFVVLFLGTYLVLTMMYSFYLSVSNSSTYLPDFVTNLVAKQSSALIKGFGYQAEVIPHETETSMKLIVNEIYLAKVVEGCNAISIIILFIAFIISFAEKFKKTFLYILTGLHAFHIVTGLFVLLFALIASLRKKIDSGHFYYPNESLHMTIKNIRVVANPPNFTHTTIEKSKKVFIHNVDNPFVCQETLELLYENFYNCDYCVPTFENKGGHPIIISNKIIQKTFDLPGDKNLNEFLRQFIRKNVPVQDNKISLNINTKEDYEKYFQII